jgi:hypothetical protein
MLRRNGFPPRYLEEIYNYTCTLTRSNMPSLSRSFQKSRHASHFTVTCAVQHFMRPLIYINSVRASLRHNQDERYGPHERSGGWDAAPARMLHPQLAQAHH